MMHTAQLNGEPHPVVASAAREVLNKSENERSGVLSTAMSFLGLYRDPTVAEVTSRCDWRIADLLDAAHPVSLYLVVPPSDISRTKPLIRLLLNQIGRRLTESLDGSDGITRRHKLLLMLDEFPALGRLDFFESALAFMAGYGLRAYLIAQSLNQIEKAYGPNNSILDNCHVRVAFASNDERTAKRISDALGTATELRAQRNYAGHRLSPWLGHLMVSRQESARPLLTPGEAMQLPPDDEIVLISGQPPLRAKKLRYYTDPLFRGAGAPAAGTGRGRLRRSSHRACRRLDVAADRAQQATMQRVTGITSGSSDASDSGLHLHPALEQTTHQISPSRTTPNSPCWTMRSNRPVCATHSDETVRPVVSHAWPCSIRLTGSSCEPLRV